MWVSEPTLFCTLTSLGVCVCSSDYYDCLVKQIDANMVMLKPMVGEGYFLDRCFEC